MQQHTTGDHSQKRSKQGKTQYFQCFPPSRYNRSQQLSAAGRKSYRYLVRMRSPVRIRVTAPKDLHRKQAFFGAFSFVFRTICHVFPLFPFPINNPLPGQDTKSIEQSIELARIPVFLWKKTRCVLSDSHTTGLY